MNELLLSGEREIFSVGGLGNGISRNKAAAISGVLASGQDLLG